MKLARLLIAAGIEDRGAAEAEVTGFAIDHRKVAPGTVFGAFQGASVNGEDFIADAVQAGAVAVVARPEARVAGPLHVADDNPRRTFARLAAQFFIPVPATIVAVTGTNGKTSTVEMTRQIWRMAGERAASIGTLGVTTPDESVSTGLTTPDIVTFLGNLSGLAREGVTHVAFEASSHGLTQYRNEGVRPQAVAFTNLSRDHLDYHADMEDYFHAKMRLFDEVVADGGSAVVWMGAEPDDWARRAVEHGGGTRTITLPLIGAYQAANALVAAGLAIATGTAPDKVWDALGRLQPVRGRLERAAISPAGAPVYVDYAHTPDAIEAAIAALRPHVRVRLITVLGAGGDRDHGKRGPMGRAAAEGSSLVIVTDDNPRGEDAASIRAAVLEGAGDDAREIGDRREAICAAIAEAGDGDIVLIAGKGHEQGQIVGAGTEMRVLPFDDVTVARECAGVQVAS